MSPLRAARAPRAAILLTLFGAVLVAACGGSDDPASDPQPASSAATESTNGDASITPESVGVGASFRSDRVLKALISAEPLEIPARFIEVDRTDREAILSLGLVGAAARVTYNSATTNEILSLDLLRLDPNVDGQLFFAAFADSLGDVRDFQSVRKVGVVRGIGEEARHITFTIEGDEGDAVALLRDGIVALAVYRRPAGLIRLIDMGDLLARLDTTSAGRS